MNTRMPLGAWLSDTIALIASDSVKLVQEKVLEQKEQDEAKQRRVTKRRNFRRKEDK